VYGYTQKEIAAYLKVTEKTVEYHVAQGLLRVRDFMSEAAKNDAQTSADASSEVRRA
jgi:RNA polymerase sigma-70 factor (ECF subfamily)